MEFMVLTQPDQKCYVVECDLIEPIQMGGIQCSNSNGDIVAIFHGGLTPLAYKTDQEAGDSHG